VVLPLLCFLGMIFYYAIYLTAVLRVTREKAVMGKLQAVERYEHVGDLDRSIFRPQETGAYATCYTAPTGGYVPLVPRGEDHVSPILTHMPDL